MQTTDSESIQRATPLSASDRKEAHSRNLGLERNWVGKLRLVSARRGRAELDGPACFGTLPCVLPGDQPGNIFSNAVAHRVSCAARCVSLQLAANSGHTMEVGGRTGPDDFGWCAHFHVSLSQEQDPVWRSAHAFRGLLSAGGCGMGRRRLRSPRDDWGRDHFGGSFDDPHRSRHRSQGSPRLRRIPALKGILQ